MIRALNSSDLQPLTALIQSGYNVSAKRISAYFDNAKTVVYDDGEIKGFAAIRKSRQDHCHLAQGVRVYVGPGYRGAGVAGALWDALLPEVQSSPADLIDTVYRVDDSEDTRQFFAHRGFESWFVSHALRYDGPRFPEPAIAWQPYDDCYFADYLRLINSAFETVRRATDVEPYVIFSAESFRDADFRQEMANNRDNLFVFLDGNQVIGLAELGDETTGEPNSIDTIGVLPGHQGHGIGRRILEFCVNRLRDRGAERVYLGVAEKNEVARHLYESAGFTPDQHIEEARLWLHR